MDDDPFLTALKARVDAFAETRNYIMSNIMPNNTAQSDDSLERKIGQLPSTHHTITLRSRSDSLTVARLNQLEEQSRDLSRDCKELLERLQPQPEHIDTNTDESNILNGMEGVL